MSFRSWRYEGHDDDCDCEACDEARDTVPSVEHPREWDPKDLEIDFDPDWWDEQ